MPGDAMEPDEPQTLAGEQHRQQLVKDRGAKPRSMPWRPSRVHLAARRGALDLPLASIWYGADRFPLVVSLLVLRWM